MYVNVKCKCKIMNQGRFSLPGRSFYVREHFIICVKYGEYFSYSCTFKLYMRGDGGLR